MPIALIAWHNEVSLDLGRSRFVLIGRPGRIPYFATTVLVLVQ
jgi:hypothetical protein